MLSSSCIAHTGVKARLANEGVIISQAKTLKEEGAFRDQQLGFLTRKLSPFT